MRFILGAALLALLVSPVASAASSIGVTPPGVAVVDAQPGQEYERHIFVDNQVDAPTTVTFTPVGEVGDWTTVLPGSGFVIPERTTALLTLTIHVPRNAQPGDHTGHLQVVAEAKDSPDGTGFALRYAVAVALDITVGGEVHEEISWRNATTRDIEVGSPATVDINVANVGNVRTSATAVAEVLALHTDEILATARGTITLIPGASGTLSLDLTDSLVPGQYRLRVHSDPPGKFEEMLAFKVVPPGTLGKDGALQLIRHDPWVDPGDLVKIDAVFGNTGTVTIGRAKFTGEVYLDDRLVGVLASEPLVALPGQHVNLTTFFTPEEPGQYRILGKVVYDGFETPISSSILNAQVGGDADSDGDGAGAVDGALTLPWWLFPLLAAGLLVLMLRLRY